MMMTDPQFWAAVSFAIFVVFAFKPIKNLVIKSLDSRSLAIEKELEEALRLKEEAELFLVSCQKRYKEVIEEAAQIMAHAKEESARLTEEAKATLEANIANRLVLTEQKINDYEAIALQEIRSRAVDVSIDAAREFIRLNLDNATSDALIEAVILETRKLH